MLTLKYTPHRISNDARTPQVCHLLKLPPPEILLLLLQYLDYNSLQVLRSMSSTFFHVLPPPTPSQLTALKYPQKSTESHRRLACYACFRMLLWFKFSTSLRRLPKEVRRRRFCIECGIRDLSTSGREDFKYARGNVWSIGEKVLCAMHGV